MPKKCVLCVTNSIGQANTIVDRLKYEAFSNKDISVLFPEKSGTRESAQPKGAKTPEGTAPGAGGVLGSALAWLSGIGPLTIAGAGPLVEAGPIAAALSGPAVGGIAGALTGMGIPENEAKRYEAKVKQGKVLISV